MPSLRLVEDKHGKNFIFTIKNQNEWPEKLVYSSSLEYDYIIMNQKGKVVKQFSKNVLSTQKEKTITLKQAQELVYFEDYYRIVKGLPNGSYKVEFMSTAIGKKIQAELEFEIK